MNVPGPIRLTAVAGALALGLVTLTACGGTSDAADRKHDGKLGVVASFYPMEFLAERIGGGHVSVETLTKPGVEPHDLELKPRQIGRLTDADVVLYLKGVQPAVDDAIDMAGVEHTVDAATLTTLEEHGASVGDGHAHEDGGSGHDDHAGHAHGGGEEAGHEGHDHGSEAGAGDPHIWLDPVRYAEAAQGVGAVFAKADPAHAADYRKNTDTLVKQLGALDTEFKDGLKNTATRTFITTHSAFGYLAERYGLEQEGVAGIDPEADPSPARVKQLQEIARENKVSTVFFETLASDRTAKTLAHDTGLRTDVLDPLEGITDQSKGDDYFQVMRANLAALKTALGAR
ncbi:metal ABC transporter substrate-binding protein [Streptomyces sp. NPDC048717]|uniref:metal ABC transporter substrate-binding protein n=1 Tax=Streptomyces sp. NPDC048717 TaxID=3154928 RepID=UPI00344543A7